MNNTDRSKAYRSKPGVMDKINSRRREAYANNAARRAKGLETNRAYRLANAEKISAQKRIAKWGFDTNEIAEKQGWLCAICRCDLKALRSRYRHVDHCHDTKVVRGMLCHRCNTAIGLMRDDPGILRLAADYVERFGIFK